MRTKPIRIVTTLLAVMLCMAAFSVSALAADETTASTANGTGKVIGDTTNADGKEFLTIKTSDNHVFYLIIDKQATGDNVYFLDTVTTTDLLSLADSGSGNSSAAATGTTTQTSDTSSGKDTSSGTAASTAAASSGTTQADKQNGIPQTAAIAIFAAVILGVILLIVKLRKPKTTAKQEKDADDYDFLDDKEPEDESEVSDEETEVDE